LKNTRPEFIINIGANRQEYQKKISNSLTLINSTSVGFVYRQSHTVSLASNMLLGNWIFQLGIDAPAYNQSQEGPGHVKHICKSIDYAYYRQLKSMKWENMMFGWPAGLCLSIFIMFKTVVTLILHCVGLHTSIYMEIGFWAVMLMEQKKYLYCRCDVNFSLTLEQRCIQAWWFLSQEKRNKWISGSLMSHIVWWNQIIISK